MGRPGRNELLGKYTEYFRKMRRLLVPNKTFSRMGLGVFAIIFAGMGAIYLFSGRAATGVPGDINADGMVSILDLSLLLSHWHQTGSSLPEDINTDGMVDILDLSVLLSHYGQSGQGGMTPMTVCANGTTFCIGSTLYYPYGASFYSSTAQSGIDSNPAGAISL